MVGRARVLTRANGPPDVRIMLVGEAPGRRGAERTLVPFAGDESGRRLDTLIQAAGWTRDELFITNAVLCNPQQANGNNRPPSTAEIIACSVWLERQIEIINPTLVVALGAVALRSLGTLAMHNLTVRNAGESPVRWNDRWLAAAYHPGARAAIHRPVPRQMTDFRSLGAWLRANAGSDVPR